MRSKPLASRARPLLMAAALLWACCATPALADVDRYFRAVLQNNESRVIELALREYDLNTRNEKNEHALHVALRAGSLAVVNFLLDIFVIEVDARNAQGETPLMLAALKGYVPEARRLIERGAEVNKPGWTPLHYAAASEDSRAVAMVHLLLEHHAYIDAESPNQTTPLMMAARYGTPEVVQLLMQEGADATLKNEQGLTALDFAKSASRKTAEQILSAPPPTPQPSPPAQ